MNTEKNFIIFCYFSIAVRSTYKPKQTKLPSHHFALNEHMAWSLTAKMVLNEWWHATASAVSLSLPSFSISVAVL